jgi:hypothetical protein
MFSKRKIAFVSIIVAFCVLTAGCFKSKTVVTRVAPGNPPEKIDGVHYSLPRTMVKAAVAFKRTESSRKAGARVRRCSRKSWATSVIASAPTPSSMR